MRKSIRRKFVIGTCLMGLAGAAAAVTPAFNTIALADHHMEAKKDIIDTATGPGMMEVTTVVTAIKAAGLVDTLKGKGPFTVFAPTNAAFDKLPKGTVEDLLKPENKQKLTGILTYHVHAGAAIKAADVRTMALTTVNGKNIAVKVADDGGVWLDGKAKVVKTDVVCTNGVIHWIDTVLMP
jgi:transforming growth factor-beta-induced protein